MLCLPNTNMNIKPAITGETVTGISIRVVKTFLPLNRNIVKNHAANSPKNVFTTSADKVAFAVSLTALIVSFIGYVLKIFFYTVTKCNGYNRKQWN